MNISNILTITRLLISPILLPFLICHLTVDAGLYLHLTACLSFFIFGLTDFFDGYFARRNGSTSRFGAALDPLADKCMIVAVGLSLLAMHKIAMWVLTLFIIREFVILTLRYVALQYDINILVSQFGKIKTVLQMLFFALLILSPDKFFIGGPIWGIIIYTLQYAAVGLTILSLWMYSFEFLRAYAART